MTDSSFITIDERAYKYIRQFTIKSAEDALVELITNSVDAYNKLPVVNKTIDIEYHESAESKILQVRDGACGLTGDQMKKCFLQVGGFTNTDDARGFFSRGAKDISAIGDITFHSIKDGKYSQVFLNSDAYGSVNILDQDVTDDLRNTLNILENGVLVEIKLLSNFTNFVPTELADSISNLAVLRDIFSNVNNTITFKHVNLEQEIFQKRLTFEYPESELLLDITYTVPNYSDSTATFKVYKSLKPIDQPKKENELVFGFLVKDSATVYEISTLDDRFRWNPYMPYLYGSVSSNYISKLLHDYDTTGSTAMNPVPIIDPSRLTGVNNSHPFIESLLSIPKVRLDQILRELNQSISNKSINLTEVDQLFDELEKYGLDIVESEEVKVKFVPEYDTELAKAIEDDRVNFVTSEKNYLITRDLNVKRTVTDNYVKEQIIKIVPTEEIQEFIFVVGENNEIVQIPYSSTREINDPVNILETVEENNPNLKTRPYIYKVGQGGELVKLYIFEKGRVESVTNPEDEYVILNNKKFNISFINDINITQRYIIENSDGIHIKLNINDSLIKKYLVTEDVAVKDDVSIANITSSVSLVFLRELITEILADVILESDIINNKVILDSNNYNNTKKILSHRNNLVNRLEDPIDNIFNKYIIANKLLKETELHGIINDISANIGQKIDLTQEGELILLKTSLENGISKHLE
jgi:hypothetical protein